jgi:hypothetical protein
MYGLPAEWQAILPTGGKTPKPGRENPEGAGPTIFPTAGKWVVTRWPETSQAILALDKAVRVWMVSDFMAWAGCEQ